jgi:hypothetical protein
MNNTQPITDNLLIDIDGAPRPTSDNPSGSTGSLSPDRCTWHVGTYVCMPLNDLICAASGATTT